MTAYHIDPTHARRPRGGKTPSLLRSLDDCAAFAASIAALHPGADYSFALKHTPDFLEFCVYLPFREPTFAEPMDVRKIFAPFLTKDDGLLEAKLALEQARLMNNIQTWVQFPGRLFILAGQNQEREICRLKHFVQALGGRHTEGRTAVEFDYIQVKAFSQELL